MTNTTQLGAAIDKLVAMWDAALSIKVFDGPYPDRSYPQDWLEVGGDGPVDAEESAATSSQKWNGLGARVRDEIVSVNCAVSAWSGSGTMKELRDRALANHAIAEAALRADPGLGNYTTGGAEMDEFELKYITNSDGFGAVITFQVKVPVRI